MTPQRVVTELLAVLGGIQEDPNNYRNLREALALAKGLATALEGQK